MNTETRTILRPAVFLCSSDRRYDVLSCLLPAVFKFWAQCPYTFYIGMNTDRELSSRATPVLAPASNWQQELAAQLAQIPEKHIIVLRDEFLFCAPVDQPRLTQIARTAITMDLHYLQLMPIKQTMTTRVRGPRSTYTRPDVRRMPAGYPNYCGLQASIWRKSYLESLLTKPQSLREFEQQSPPDAGHCAITHSPPIQYRQMLKREYWLPDAAPLLKRAGLPADLGNRPVWSKSTYLRMYVDRIRQTLFGVPTGAEQTVE